jgi:hypothetical protein
MVAADGLRDTKLALNNGSGAIPALGFGTLIPDPVATRNATKAAFPGSFREKREVETVIIPRHACHRASRVNGLVRESRSPNCNHLMHLLLPSL